MRDIKQIAFRKLEGATFEQLVEINNALENAKVFDSDIHNAIMDRMEAVDAYKFLEWARRYNIK